MSKTLDVPHIKLNMNDLEKKLREDMPSGEISPQDHSRDGGLGALPNPSPIRANYDSNTGSPIVIPKPGMAIDLSMIIKKRDLD